MQMAVRRDGRIVLAGYVHGAARHREALAAVRLMPNGAPDRSFGRDGVAALRIGHRSFATSVAILRADGTLDRRFAHEGIARSAIPPEPRSLSGPRRILLTHDWIFMWSGRRGGGVHIYGRNGDVDRSFADPSVLEPVNPRSSLLAALQRGKLLLLEGNRRAVSSFTLRRFLLR